MSLGMKRTFLVLFASAALAAPAGAAPGLPQHGAEGPLLRAAKGTLHQASLSNQPA